jgi:dienelactone hydrolase
MSAIPEALLRHLYAYDRTLPLLATSESEPAIDLATRQARTDIRRERVTFGSTHDERMLATVITPTPGGAHGNGPWPAVIVQHGSTPLGRHGNVTPTPTASDPVGPRWAASGLVVVAVDAYGFGSREAPDNRGRLTPTRPDLMFRTRDQRMQAIQDLMRTVDYLQTRPDVRHDAIAYHGVSMGCRIGVPFIALDHRVKAASLFVGGSGDYSRFITAGTEFADLADDEATINALTDAATFAPFTGHIPKFVVNGEKDDTVGGREPAERLQAAMADPKEIHWYDGGHGDFGPALVEEARQFLARHLGA